MGSTAVLSWVFVCFCVLVQNTNCSGFHGFVTGSSTIDYYYYDYLELLPFTSDEGPDCVDLVATDTVQYFTSHDTYDGTSTTYEQFTTLCWNISAENSGKSVELTTEAIDLVEDNKYPLCTDDLSIFDGSGYYSVPIVYGICVTDSTLPTITSMGDSLFISFRAGGATNPGFGFNLGYRQVDSPTCAMLEANDVVQSFTSHTGSSDYPSRYFDCWNMTFNAPMVEISSDNSHFELEYAPTCAFDKLAIAEGESKFVSAFCGKTDRTAFYLDKVRFSEQLELMFRSDSSRELSGFELEYHTRDCHYFSDTCGSFVSHDGYGHDYYRDHWYDCWIIEASSPIILKFKTFDVEPDKACGYDFVKVYDGTAKDDPLLGIFCGTKRPSPIQSTGNSLFVEFKSDSFSQGHGFKIEYRAKDDCCTPPAPGFPEQDPPFQECMSSCICERLGNC